MSKIYKQHFLRELEKRYGNFKKLPNSFSLFEIADGQLRIYYRYSKIHNRGHAFYGLRKEDLKQLEGKSSLICFTWDNQKEPLFIPFADYEEILNSITPASDGQIKTSIFLSNETELYFPGLGRFNVDGYYGWETLNLMIDRNKITFIPDFTHSQIQTIIGAIGSAKGYDVWIPQNDRIKLDWTLSNRFSTMSIFPQRYEKVKSIVEEVDVIWLQRGGTDVKAMFEVEHSTTIYSGLLRFNDLHLTEPKLLPKFSIVSNEIRKALFLRQINRPTFRLSGLIDHCNFLDYKDVYTWYNRLIKYS